MLCLFSNVCDLTQLYLAAGNSFTEVTKFKQLEDERNVCQKKRRRRRQTAIKLAVWPNFPTLLGTIDGKHLLTKKLS